MQDESGASNSTRFGNTSTIAGLARLVDFIKKERAKVKQAEQPEFLIKKQRIAQYNTLKPTNHDLNKITKGQQLKKSA